MHVQNHPSSDRRRRGDTHLARVVGDHAALEYVHHSKQAMVTVYHHGSNGTVVPIAAVAGIRTDPPPHPLGGPPTRVLNAVERYL